MRSSIFRMVIVALFCFWGVGSGARVDAEGSGSRSSGGPDSFGYTWSDQNEDGGPSFDWLDISGTGTDLSLGDDEYYYSISLPFSFDFYGTVHSEVAVASNGTVYFTDAYLGGDNWCLPGVGGYGITEFIALFFDDLDPGSAGAVYYEILGNAPTRRLLVQFDGVSLKGSSDLITAQVALFESSNNILFQYLDPGGSFGGGATIGIQGDASTALEIGCNYDSLNPNMAVCIAYPGTGDPACSAPVAVDLQSFSVN